MAIEVEKLNVTELDFQTIKSNLIDYFKNDRTEFTDWDFEGSNLNMLMDILAYNTHYNAMLAHMAVNESFIDSAQLRGSIVSAAKLLGYVPRSYSAATAKILGGATGARFVKSIGDNIVNSVTTTLDKGTRFIINGTNGTFQFLTLEDYTLTLNGDYYYAPETGITVHEGTLITKEYLANAQDVNHRYVITDKNIDLTTLKIKVYPNVSYANENDSPIIFNQYKRTALTDLNENIKEDTAIFFITENSFGQYEIQFGNNIFGRALNSGNIIRMEYLITNGSAANGLNAEFRMQGIINRNLSGNGDRLTYVGVTSGGGERETNNELKKNATTSFMTQNRAVTADDYKAIISETFPDVGAVTVWGGEDNDPPEYGKAFISLIPKENVYSGNTFDSIRKSNILNYLQNKKILSIIPKIVDPTSINIVLDILYKYNSNLLGNESTSFSEQIRTNVIEKFNNEELNKFDTVFRHSQFQKLLDNYSPIILNSLVRVFVKSSPLTIKANTNIQNNEIDFGVPLVVDDGKAIIDYKTTSTVVGQERTLIDWTETIDGITTKIFLGETASGIDLNIRNLYTYTINTLTKDEVKIRDIGTLNLQDGKIIILPGVLISDVDLNLSITAIPRSNDIVAKRNKFLRFALDDITISPSVDEIISGGASRSINYTTFSRDR